MHLLHGCDRSAARSRRGHHVSSLRELPTSKLVLCDVTPTQLVSLAGDAAAEPLPPPTRTMALRAGRIQARLRAGRPDPVARRPRSRDAGTVHLGGTLDEIAESERAAWDGRHAERPFVLLAQQSLFDETRAPPGKHTAWAYCHVPNGSTFDMRERVEAQIERFAPGFRERVLACASRTTADLERDNPNLVGGDISGGANTLRQLLARPVLRRSPYSTPVPWLYLCSASTPPGAGVHGMCGHLAARAALRAG